MSPGHAHLAVGRVVLDGYLYHVWRIEGGSASYRGQFDARLEATLGAGGFTPSASASLVVSTQAVASSGIAKGKRIVVDGRVYVVAGDSPQPQATIFYLEDPNT